jgi:hypothetical protein
LLDMAAERGRPAPLDGRHDAALCGGQAAGLIGAIGVAWRRKMSATSSPGRMVSAYSGAITMSASWSNGLGVPAIRSTATWV